MPDDDRYTLRRAVSECQWGLALAMVCDAGICLCLAVLGAPPVLNAIATVLFGPLGCVVAVIGRWRRQR